MGIVVSLDDVVEAMDLPNSAWQSYLNRGTGKIVTVTDEDEFALELENDGDLPEWQRKRLPEIREAVESDECLQLPDRFDIHEWSIMERYCHQLGEAGQSEELLDAIRGKGAFRLFRRTIERFGLREDWDEYRESALRRIAKGWLEANGIAYR